MVPLYWSLAFIIGAAIPQVQTISGLVAAVCIMQFTYTFPPLLVWGYLVRMDGLTTDGRFSLGQVRPPFSTAISYADVELLICRASALLP
jgi:TRAP-type mannitol/chloroaromatic compound transport system permease large subunit